MSALEAVALVLIAGLGGSIIFYTLLLGSGPVPSNATQIRGVLQALESLDGSPIYELGAGFGRVAFAVADRFPERRVVGLERSWVPYLVCRLRLGLTPLPNLSFRRDDFLKAPLGEAKVLLSYVHTGAMAALASKLQIECRGALLVSHTFGMRGWEPQSQVTLDDLYRSRVYVYRV